MMVRDGKGTLLACPDCDLLYREIWVPRRTNACCARCDALLYRNDPGALNRALAWTVTGGLLLVLANVFPVMVFSYGGKSQSNTLVEGVIELASGGVEFVALVVFLTSVVFPILRTAGLLYVLLPLQSGRRLPLAPAIFRSVSALEKWGMLDVYALAILVTVVKLGQLAEAHIGIGCFALVAAAAAMIATGSALDRRDVWRRLEAAR
ncbi:MAG: paraquat-inducible protein A [Deltaproteobacteria bacterium]